MEIECYASEIGIIKRMILGEKWVVHHFNEKEIKIIRGTEQNEVISTHIGLPDYYLPDREAFIEEKKFLKTKLGPGQFEMCLYLDSIGFPVFIAIRNTGAIWPLYKYLARVPWPKNWRVWQ